jgi:RNA polymerase sigma factor (sigma-70 family)
MRRCSIDYGERGECSENPALRERTSGEAFPRSHPCAGMHAEQVFLAHLDFIERSLARQARRYRLPRDEAEDFASWAKLKLIADGYKVFRTYKGESILETYLTVVMQRLALDYLDRLWGKWRPSAEAKRRGALAVRIERLQRDGHSPAEIRAALRTGSVCELEEITTRLPSRVRRRLEGEEQLSVLQAPDASPEQLLEERERTASYSRVLAALNQALARLSPEERAFARLRGRLSIAEIARLTGMEEKPFYRQMGKILRTLRRAMQDGGVRGEDIRDVLGRSV